MNSPAAIAAVQGFGLTLGLAKRLLDWRPRVALDDGLPQAIAYFRDSSSVAP